MLQEALEQETNETAKSMLSSMLDNLDIAKAQDKAVCQSPGYPTSWISYGENNFPAVAPEAIMEALEKQPGKATCGPVLSIR